MRLRLDIFLLFYLIRFIGALSYEEKLDDILNGVVRNVDNSSAIVNYKIDSPYKSGVKVNYRSESNGKAILDYVMMHKYAIVIKKWGDAVLLQNVIKNHGTLFFNQSYDLFVKDLVVLGKNNETLIEIWANSSSNEKLASIYKNLKTQ